MNIIRTALLVLLLGVMTANAAPAPSDYSAPAYALTPPPTAIVQRSSSFSNPLVWLMPGHAGGNYQEHDRVAVERPAYINGNPAPDAAAVSPGSSADPGAPAAGAPTTSANPWTDNVNENHLHSATPITGKAPAAAQQSAGDRLLHGLFWIAGLAALGIGITWLLMRHNAQLSAKATH